MSIQARPERSRSLLSYDLPALSDNPDDLLHAYYRTRDLELRNRLVLLHQPLVRFLVTRFASSGGNTHEDLFQVGCLGLIAAIERFDPEAGTRFTTFAAPTIVGTIQHHLRGQGWMVTAPRRLRELSTRLRRTRAVLDQRNGRPPTVSELAAELGVDEEQILRSMEVEQLYEIRSLDAPPDKRDADARFYGDGFGQWDSGMLEVERREWLERGFEHLDKRAAAILRLRFYDEVSQAEVARRLGLSQMHVSRLERQALEKLRHIMS